MNDDSPLPLLSIMLFLSQDLSPRFIQFRRRGVALNAKLFNVLLNIMKS